MSLKKFKLYHLGLLILFVASFTLRFINLSYSEFQDDEQKTYLGPEKNESNIEFLLRQRKGPMQFLISYIPFSMFKEEVNELAVRLPFTLFNFLSVFVLYGFIYKVTKSHLASLLTSLLYSINGFIVGFSRIAQYQNLNLLFSFLSLYFFADLKYKRKDFMISAVIGAVFTSLSILSHWDAVFYAIPVIYFLGFFIFRRDISKKEKVACIFAIFLVGAILVLPYFGAYIFNLISQQSGNVDYLFKRIGIEGSLFSRHRYIFELYNPVITLWLYLFGLAACVLFIKKTGVFFFWFVFNLLLIKFFMITPKTHIYNYVFPGIIASSLGIYYFYDYVSTKLKILRISVIVIMVIFVSLLYVQSYQIFVDHKKEYPFDAKKILWHQNHVFIDNEIITFGFPHNRNWKKVDEIISPSCRYITNESKGISQIYIRAKYGFSEDCYYLVVIKKPFYTKNSGVVYAQARGPKLVYQYVRDGEVLTRVYRLR